MSPLPARRGILSQQDGKVTDVIGASVARALRASHKWQKSTVSCMTGSFCKYMARD